MTWTKDPSAVLDYGVDWSKWLQAGEVINSSTWIVQTGITAANDSFGSTTTAVWLSGGVDGTTYLVTNRVTTSAGRTDDRTLRVHVDDR